jgi:predicted nucleotidyltransferase
MKIGYKIYKETNGAISWSLGRVEKNWRFGDGSFGVVFKPESKKVWKDLSGLKNHLSNALERKVDISSWKIVEVEYKDVALEEVMDQKLLMKLLQHG